VGKDGAERGNVPLHCSIAIRDPVYKYAEIVMDDSGIYIFVSANEIDRISDKGSAKYYFRGRKPNEKKGNLIDEIKRMVRELGEPLKVVDLGKYGFEPSRDK
jgi:ribosomal protein L15E